MRLALRARKTSNKRAYTTGIFPSFIIIVLFTSVGHTYHFIYRFIRHSSVASSLLRLRLCFAFARASCVFASIFFFDTILDNTTTNIAPRRKPSTDRRFSKKMIPANLSQGQTDELFEIFRQKAEDEKAAAAEEAKLRLALMRKESDARIAAATAAAAVSTLTSAPPRMDCVDDSKGEIPQEANRVGRQFAGLPQEEIVRICLNRFKPINLYRLRHMCGTRYEAFRDEEPRTPGTYKDYGKSFMEVWSESFYNYTAIMDAFFGRVAPDLQLALLRFYGVILQLSKVYDWQEAVLPMAIEVHTHIVAQQPLDPKNWKIPVEFKNRLCSPMDTIDTRITGGVKRKRSKSPPSRFVAARNSL